MFADDLEKLKTHIPTGRPVVYFDYAVYGNVGDMLIHKATEYFFELNDNRVLDAFNLQNYERGLDKSFPLNTVVVFQGGGNFGDLFPRHDQLRLAVLERFRQHQAVVLPQTVYFENDQSCRDTMAAYNAHDRLTLCLRDTRSYDAISGRARVRTDLLPDMAHMLAGSDWVKSACADAANADPGELYFMREPWRIEETDGADNRFDVRAIDVWNWPQYLTEREKQQIALARRLHRWDRKYFHSRLPLGFWRTRRDAILERALAFFAAHETIHTNRLHGGLFGLLCNKPVVLYDTGYGKLKGYYSTWFTDEPRVRFAGAVQRRAVSA